MEFVCRKQREGMICILTFARRGEETEHRVHIGLEPVTDRERPG